MIEDENCKHCGDKVVIPSTLNVDDKDLLFCCNGCKTVYKILHDRGFENYYQLKSSSGNGPSNPVIISSDKYLYLNDHEFLDKYSTVIGETRVVKFYLEGIHCVACLWLIEKLPDFLPELILSELNMSKSVCTITAKKDFNFSKVAKQLEVLGHKPHPIMENAEVEELARREDHKMLIKIAVAFAGAGNIMLLAIAIYAGLDGILKEYFRWLNLYLSLPVVLYSATPFYVTAFSALKNKKISIDIPIVIAIILVMTTGVYNLTTGSDHIYFDSISVLIFLLLFARFILTKAQQKGLSATEVSSFFSNQIAHKLKGDTDKVHEYDVVHAKFLKKSDKIIVPAGENIPIDGLVLKGTTSINSSLLTGESAPEKVNKGSYVYSGTINLDSDIIVQVLNTVEDSRLGKILKSVESGWKQKADIVHFADVVAKYFIISVFTLAFVIAFYFGLHGNWETGLMRALTLVIITCPCALGLTTPLALTLTLGRLAKNGIIIKNEHVIEKLTKAKDIFLDKTGTLTYGSFQVIQWVITPSQDENIEAIIYALESRSKHPIARAITQHLERKYHQLNTRLNPAEISNFSETPGIGVNCDFEDNKYEIKANKETIGNTTSIAVYKNGTVVTTIYLKDELRKDAKECIHKIKKLKLTPWIISGDNKETVSEISKELLIKNENSFSRVSPENKKSFILKNPKAIMVGDGANDAMALSSAFVGIAVHGSVDISLRAADIYISKSGVKYLAHTITAAHDTIKVIKRNLYFSLAYNLFGAALAITGNITPLFAAVLMPISSLTVLVSTFVSTKNIRALTKIN